MQGTAKRKEVVDVFEEGMFKLLFLAETKMKVNVKILWCRMSGICMGYKKMKGQRKGVVAFLNDV